MPRSSIADRADALTALATLLDAGLDHATACHKLSEQMPGSTLQWSAVLKHIREGSNLIESLSLGKVISQADAIRLQLAEKTGNLDSALQQQGQHYRQQYLRYRQVSSQLWLPSIVLLIGLLAALVLSMTGSQSTGESASQPVNVAFSLVLYTALTLILLKLIQIDRQHWLSLGWRLYLPRRLSVFQTYFEEYFLGMLAKQLAAGIDAATALEHLVLLLSTSDFQARCRNASRLTQHGMDLSSALGESGLLLTNPAQQLLHSAEAAGESASALIRHTEILTNQTQSMTDTLYTRLPRIWYVLAIMLISQQL